MTGFKKDEIEGHAFLRSRSKVPIALGENLRACSAFKQDALQKYAFSDAERVVLRYLDLLADRLPGGS